MSVNRIDYDPDEWEPGMPLYARHSTRWPRDTIELCEDGIGTLEDAPYIGAYCPTCQVGWGKSTNARLRKTCWCCGGYGEPTRERRTCDADPNYSRQLARSRRQEAITDRHRWIDW